MPFDWVEAAGCWVATNGKVAAVIYPSRGRWWYSVGELEAVKNFSTGEVEVGMRRLITGDVKTEGLARTMAEILARQFAHEGSVG